MVDHVKLLNVNVASLGSTVHIVEVVENPFNNVIRRAIIPDSFVLPMLPMLNNGFVVVSDKDNFVDFPNSVSISDILGVDQTNVYVNSQLVDPTDVLFNNDRVGEVSFSNEVTNVSISEKVGSGDNF